MWFYGISTIECYLMPNPLLHIETVLFQTIQFSLSTQLICEKQFCFNQFSLESVHCLILFDSIWS